MFLVLVTVLFKFWLGKMIRFDQEQYHELVLKGVLYHLYPQKRAFPKLVGMTMLKESKNKWDFYFKPVKMRIPELIVIFSKIQEITEQQYNENE